MPIALLNGRGLRGGSGWSLPNQCAVRPGTSVGFDCSSVNVTSQAYTAFLSPVAKLLLALRHQLDHNWRAALILEDDAIVDVGSATMQALSAALDKLEREHAGWHTLSVGGFGGSSRLPRGLRTLHPFMIMPAIGTVITYTGAEHILSNAVPVRANVDMTLSFEGLPTVAPRGKGWYLLGRAHRDNFTFVVRPGGAAVFGAHEEHLEPVDGRGSWLRRSRPRCPSVCTRAPSG
jgi:hypothetical protein